MNFVFCFEIAVKSYLDDGDGGDDAIFDCIGDVAS